MEETILFFKRRENCFLFQDPTSLEKNLWTPLSNFGSKKLWNLKQFTSVSEHKSEERGIIFTSKEYSLLVSLIQVAILANVPLEEFKKYLQREMQSFVTFLENNNDKRSSECWNHQEWTLVRIFIE